MPKGIDGKDKIPDGKGKDVDEEPDDVHWLEGREEDEEGGETKDGSKKDQGDPLRGGHECGDDQHTGKGDGSRQNERARQLHENDKLHGATKDPAQVTDQDELKQVVYGAVDPSTSLGEEHAEGVRAQRSCTLLGEQTATFSLEMSLASV